MARQTLGALYTSPLTKYKMKTTQVKDDKEITQTPGSQASASTLLGKITETKVTEACYSQYPIINQSLLRIQ